MKRFPTFWFFAIGILIGLAAIPATLYIKAQSVLWEISVANEAVSQRLFLPTDDPPRQIVEEAAPGTAVDELQPEIDLGDAYVEPKPDPERINLLLLGIRGLEDPYGGTLTDSIMLASFKPATGQLALISVPRDLYIKIPFQGVYSKINAAYAFGHKIGGERGGLELARHAVQYVTGQHIDYVMRADFEAFEKAVNTLGGVTINLDKPFAENLQWVDEGGFYLPAGENTLNGKQALYYVRSRYSTSDFDRARRQQQLLLALKDKASALEVVANPSKISDLLSIVGEHVRTDMDVETMKSLTPLARRIDFGAVRTKVFDNSPGGRLYSTILSKQYILLPKGGSFSGVRQDTAQIIN